MPEQRTLHLSDVENLMGGPRAGTAALHRARRRYAALAPPGPTDHVVAACNPHLLLDAVGAWFPSRWLARRGPHGAEQALIEDLDVDFVSTRYERVVIGSGNHAFAAAARALRDQDVQVVAVARPGSISADLYRAVHEFLPLGPHSDDERDQEAA